MTDFVVSFILFILIVVIVSKVMLDYFQDDHFEVVRTDADLISESLLGLGNPVDWDNQTVVRIGLTTDNRVDKTKLEQFSVLNYSTTLSLFGSRSNYVFQFSDAGVPLNISLCAYGKASVIDGCDLDFTDENYEDLVKVERLTIYNSTIIRMAVYTW